jgi:hypothetical protein
MSGTETLSWRPIEATDVPACTVLLAAIEDVDQTGDVFGEEDLLETFREPGRDPRGSTCVHDGDVMVGYCCLSSGSADQVHQMSLFGGVHPAHRRQGIRRPVAGPGRACCCAAAQGASSRLAAVDIGMVLGRRRRGERPVRIARIPACALVPPDGG